MACFNSDSIRKTCLQLAGEGNPLLLLVFIQISLLFFLYSSNVRAEFALNFEPVADKYQPLGTHWGIGPPTDYWIYRDQWDDNGTPDYLYDDKISRWDDRYTRWVDYSNISLGEAGGRLYGQSPFLIQRWAGGYETPELVTDESNGKQYWHVLVVDPFNDFKQEVFIEAVYGVKYGERTDGTLGINHSHPIVTNDKVYGYYDMPGSASGGGTNDYELVGGSQYAGGNQSRIFSDAAGNGSADPRKVIVRQVFDDGEMKQEYLKEQYDKKPLITQKVKNSELDMYFEIDMRSLDYVSEQLTPGTVVNKIALLGNSAPGETGNFDASEARFIDKVNVTGGKFIYVEPPPGMYSQDTGTANGANGTYQYASGEYDQYSIQWAYYLDPATFTGTTIQVPDTSTPDPNDTTSLVMNGVSLEDRLDIKGNGWEFQGWGADTWWIQKTNEEPTYGTSQDITPIVNPWSYSQPDFCSYGPC